MARFCSRAWLPDTTMEIYARACAIPDVYKLHSKRGESEVAMSADGTDIQSKADCEDVQKGFLLFFINW